MVQAIIGKDTLALAWPHSKPCDTLHRCNYMAKGAATPDGRNLIGLMPERYLQLEEMEIVDYHEGVGPVSHELLKSRQQLYLNCIE